VSRTYTAAGTYHVTFSFTNVDGQQAETSMEVVVL